MNSKVFLSEDQLLEAKCAKCGRYLSVPPITIDSENPVCGRCVQYYGNLEDKRAHFYENLAKFMFFPCINDVHGCRVKSPWGKVLAHEIDCQFGVTICPAIDCEQEVSHETVITHFKKDHSSLILEGSEYHLTYSADKYLFMNELFIWKDQPLVVQTKTDGMDVFLRISSFEEHITNDVNLKLIIKSELTANSVSLNEFKLMKYESKLPVFSNKEKIRINQLRNILGSDVQCIFNLEDIIKPHNGEANYDKMLLELECPVCSDYMTPPIYMCSTGHSICRNCKIKLLKCPSCSAKLCNTRNFALENVTECVVYPCIHKDQGCAFTANLKHIIQHNSSCRISPEIKVKCNILPCKWKGPYTQFYQHLSLLHPAHCIDFSYPLIIDIRSSTQVAVKYDNRIFKLRIYWDLDGIKQSHWAVMYIRNTERDEDEYMFHLEFVDGKRTLAISEACESGGAADINRDCKKYIDIPFNLLEPFTKGDQLIFKLNLVKR